VLENTALDQKEGCSSSQGSLVCRFLTNPCNA